MSGRFASSDSQPVTRRKEFEMATASDLIQDISARLAENTTANFAKNAGEEAAAEAGKKVGEYLSSFEFTQQVRTALERLVGGPTVMLWIGRIVGILAATIIGTPNLFVILVMLFEKDPIAARHIVSEVVDEFAKTFAVSVARGVPIKDATEDALTFSVSPTMVRVLKAVDELSGIVYRDLIATSVHALTCQKMYKTGTRMGGPPDKKDRKPGEELKEGATIMTVKDMILQGIDPSVSGCECRGVAKEFRELLERPRTFLDCLIALQKGSSADLELEKAFSQAYERLISAKVEDTDLILGIKAFKVRLGRQDWTLDRARYAIRYWAPQANASLAVLIERAKIAFDFKINAVDIALHAGGSLLKAVYAPHGEHEEKYLVRARAFSAKVSKTGTSMKTRASTSIRNRKKLGF